MTARNTDHESASEVRTRAEEIAALSPEEAEPLSPASARLTLHELRVHPIELEILQISASLA